MLVVPSAAVAQRDPFFSALVEFHRSLSGAYGDERAQITTALTAMSTALERWDSEIRDAEATLRPRLTSADAQTSLQAHTLLASLYLERGRLADAAREFDEDIRIDPRRAAFHRFKGLILQAMSRPADAADAFRAAWQLDPADPQNAYRLIAHRSGLTTSGDIDRALEALANIERELVRRERPSAPRLFTGIGAIVDEAGGGMAFVPAAYVSGFSLVFRGELEQGVAAFRAATAGDPLLTDPSFSSQRMAQGIAALRQGRVEVAIEHLEAAVAAAADSSEAHRALGTAYSVAGDIAKTVHHLRTAVRLHPSNERAWLALARILEEAGRTAEAEEALREAVVAVPASGALLWQLSTTSEPLHHAGDADLLATPERFVLLVGKGEMYRALARLANLNRDYEREIELLQQAALVTPNTVVSRRALGRALVENGRDSEGYAELVIGLLLDAYDGATLTELGRLHLMADRPARALEALERAVGIDPANRLAVRALRDALIRGGQTAAAEQRLEESERLQARANDDDRRAKAAAALRVTAELRMQQRDYAGAVDLWREAIALQGGNASPHLRLAEALAAAKRPDEAVTEYLTAVSLNAGSDVHRRLAELYDAMGHPADAGRERARHVERRLQELRRRAEGGAYGF